MRLRRLLAGGFIALAAAAAGYVLTHWQLFEGTIGQAETRTVDYRMRSASDPAPQESRVALLLFDSATVKAWPYEVPFPRPILADLVEIAAEAGADVIGLDVFLERRNEALDERFGPGDARLRAAIEEAGNVILAAPTIETDAGRVLVEPDPYFAEVAAGVATVDVPTPYETVRDFVLTVRTADGTLVPGFALAAYAAAQGMDLDSLLLAAQRQGRLALPGLPARFGMLDEDAVQVAPLLFTGPPSRTDRDDGSFVAVSADVVQSLQELPPEFRDPGFLPFQDRVVLLGSGFHAEERFRTPFYDERDDTGAIRGWTYGVEVLATALQNLLSGRMPVPLGRAATAGLLLLVTALVTAATFWRGVTWGAVAGVLLLTGEIAVAWALFAERQLHVPIVGPMLAGVFAFIGASSYTSIVEGKEKRRIRGAFSKYLAPAVVSELVEDPSRLKLGGEKRPVTLMFTDLAGFTSLSETMEPEALLSLLNEYLDEMVAIVLHEGGTLDKYIGDAIMAMYGAPNAMDDHPLRACRSALRMQRRLKQLNDGWAELGRPPLHMRVGINTGTPVVGNIGGEQRFDYTALGDAVNLAARLEPACKTYGVDTMISGNTREAAGEGIMTRELDLLAVYGKVEPVGVFELIGLAGETLDETQQELLRHYESGIEAYRNRDFELALQYLQAASGVDPQDGPTLLYLERCRNFLVTPPPADWDAVERRQFK